MPHIHEKYDFTVSIFIVHDAKVLLVEHPRYNMWLAPGGHIELDEDPDEALFREIKEETGLEDVAILSQKPGLSDPDRKSLFTPNFIDSHDANPPHRHITLIYFAAAKDNKHVKSDEHTKIQWFSIRDLDKADYISPDIKFYAKEAIKLASKN